MAENEETEETKETLVLPIGLVIVVILIWAGTWFGVFHYLPAPDDWQKRGQFGDLFGAANALFSGLAFAGIIYTIYLQRKEIALQRKELKTSRDILIKSAEAQEISASALNEQTKLAVISAKLNVLNSSLSVISELVTQYSRGGSINYPDTYRSLVEKKESIAADILKILEEI